MSTVTPDGDVYVGDVSAGDLWYFPAGFPHSIQAKDTSPGGAEFLLVFDDGAFSEDGTFLLTDWLAHVPKEVLAKNFGMANDLQAFDRIPDRELYIFPCACSLLCDSPLHSVFFFVFGSHLYMNVLQQLHPLTTSAPPW